MSHYQQHFNKAGIDCGLLCEGDYITYHTRHGGRFTSRIVAINHQTKALATMKGHAINFSKVVEVIA